jgi:type II secretory pathway pseudopilin PulG
MLVVIAVLSVLAALIVPSVLAMRKRTKVLVSQQLIEQIEAGIQEYHEQHGDYPDPEVDGLDGAQSICLYMIGWPGDYENDGQAQTDSKKFSQDDGKADYGWRRPDSPRGRVYGPYQGLEAATRSEADEPVFFDEFGNTIWYGRYEGGAMKGLPASLPAKYTQDASNEYYRKDYVLFSAGPDGEFQRLADDPQSDDITNFFPE